MSTASLVSGNGLLIRMTHQ